MSEGGALPSAVNIEKDILHPGRRMAKDILAQISSGIDEYRLRG